MSVVAEPAVFRFQEVTFHFDLDAGPAVDLADARPSFVRAELDTLFETVRAAASRDDGTLIHMVRIGFLAERLALLAGESVEFAATLRSAGPLCDIGKVEIPDSVLKKRGLLTTLEREIVQKHCAIGAGMLSHSSHPLFQLASIVALNHHERFDGGGYPSRLVGDQIPLAARIVSVVDVFDALTMDRSYRAAYHDMRALAMMVEQSGKNLDPALVDCFLMHSEELIELRNRITMSPPDCWQALGFDRYTESPAF
jgi:putative two-component system response regulator